MITTISHENYENLTKALLRYRSILRYVNYLLLAHCHRLQYELG